jgi:hypothetical protein
LASLTPYLAVPKAVTSLAQTSGVATCTTTAAHGFPIGSTLWLVIAGATYTAYNGTFLCHVTTTSAFTYAVPSGTTSPDISTAITYTTRSAVEMTQMNTTFFAQGSNTACYVLELGPGNTADGCAFLSNWIAQNPPGINQGDNFWGFYSYLVPRYWDADPAYLNLLASFENTTALTYFWTTTTLSTYTAYTAQMKCVKALIEAPAYGVWPANVLTAISYAAAWGVNVLTAISWAATNGGIVTAATTSAHGVLPGNTFSISGCTPAGYNGTFVALPGTGVEALIYALATNPGAESVLGTLVASTGGTVTATTTTNHGVLPGQWFQIAGCLPVAYNGWWQAGTATATNSLVFAVPAAIGTETLLGTLVMSQYASAGVAATEFSRAAGWWVTLNYAPSSSNRVTPYNYSFIYGVTPFPVQGNNSLLTTLLNNNIEVVGTGAEGGLSNTIAYGGNFLDGNAVNWWWGIDWLNINANLNLSNFVINGDNNPQNPLFSDQDGINIGQSVVASTIISGITFGIIYGTLAQTELSGPAFATNSGNGVYNGQAVVNAVPAAIYYAASPSDYKIGLYAGYAVSFTPLRGFDNITIDLNATQYVG